MKLKIWTEKGTRTIIKIQKNWKFCRQCVAAGVTVGGRVVLLNRRWPVMLTAMLGMIGISIQYRTMRL